MDAREIIESWALWGPDVFRARPARFFKDFKSPLFVWDQPKLDERTLPGRAVMAIGRERFKTLTSDQLVNVAPWWIKMVCE